MKIVIKKRNLEILFILQTLVLLIAGLVIVKNVSDRFNWFTCLGGLLVTATGMFNSVLFGQYLRSDISTLPDQFEWRIRRVDNNEENEE